MWGKLKFVKGGMTVEWMLSTQEKKKKQSERVTGELGRKAIHRNIHRNIRETG